jgi:cytochrome c oxidase cbb3-type subunit 2
MSSCRYKRALAACRYKRALAACRYKRALAAPCERALATLVTLVLGAGLGAALGATLGAVSGCSGAARRPAARAAKQAAPPGPGFFGARPGEEAPPPQAPPETGRRLYDNICASCHGADGRGDTTLASQLEVAPHDLTRCNFKYRSTPSGSLPTDRDLLRTLYVGIPGTEMPSFAGLAPLPELRALVTEVKRRCDRFASEEPGTPLPTPRWEAYSDESAARGRAVYRREGCNSCHGDGGRGDGPAAAPLKDAMGRKIRPRDHTQGRFRSGFGRGDIYRAFSTGLDGTPMPALPAAVSAADRWDLTHHIVSLSTRRGELLRALVNQPTWFEPARTRGLRWR